MKLWSKWNSQLEILKFSFQGRRKHWLVHFDSISIFQLSYPRKFSVTNLSSFNWCVETKLHTSLNSRKVKLQLYLCYLYMFFLFQNYFVAAIFSITPPTIPSFEMEEESWKNFLKYVHYVSRTMSFFQGNLLLFVRKFYFFLNLVCSCE